ncbi:hypothetical protein GE21DRAFT_1043035 [Neurospora crassa]|nr:hypothetical protein GE21DRAFT_1043035 [Neurospora crassa]
MTLHRVSLPSDQSGKRGTYYRTVKACPSRPIQKCRTGCAASERSPTRGSLAVSPQAGNLSWKTVNLFYTEQAMERQRPMKGGKSPIASQPTHDIKLRRAQAEVPMLASGRQGALSRRLDSRWRIETTPQWGPAESLEFPVPSCVPFQLRFHVRVMSM